VITGTPSSPPLGGVEALLEEARERTLRLVEGVSGPDLDRVHDQLMSPLAWDVGHIAAFEDLWVSREAGTELLREDLADVYDAFETPRAGRGDLRYLRHESCPPTWRPCGSGPGASTAPTSSSPSPTARIRTEISAKFTRDAVERELHAAGLALDDFFTDGAGLFGLAFASPR
jgi:DinB superfamily/Histidine-specific methyltransferase, SAM-dependent